MAKEYKITSLRLQDLEKELNYLKTTREREIAAMIAEARSYGDLSENSEYDAAKNEQAKLYGRIAEIEDVRLYPVKLYNCKDFKRGAEGKCASFAPQRHRTEICVSNLLRRFRSLP